MKNARNTSATLVHEDVLNSWVLEVSSPKEYTYFRLLWGPQYRGTHATMVSS